ncbi:MAG TPA: delta-lactam-biosynthetic de-N-acetylase [Candidatus Paenibacillus intestinavium]|nr:delta-lactam-biosynthetic de-N-acetylase [Candidatus Paenibacillus intestinavium]
MRIVVMLFVLLSCTTAQLSSEKVSAAEQDKTHHFGFKKSVDEKLPSIQEEGFAHIIEKNNALFLGNTSKKVLYLTFDNGYENGFTTPILDILKGKQVPAAFFVTGHYIQDQPELIRRMAKEGHIIGNHSWSHPDMTTMSNDQIRQELTKVKDGVAQLTGQSMMNYLRPPRGIFNDRVLAISYEEGYISAFWSLAYKDWEVNKQRGADYAYQQIMKQIHPGSIMLIHSVSSDNAGALARIIDDVRAKGYTFESLDQLMAERLLENLFP